MARFGEGQIQNKKGRPKSPVALKQDDFKRLFATHAPELINRCIQMALFGSEKCMQICMDRIIPKIREEAKSEGQTVLEMLNAGRLKVDTSVEPVSLSEPQAQIESELKEGS